MPCHVIRLPGGGTAIVMMAAPRRRKCSVCARKTCYYRLCDGSNRRGKTCDAVLCEACTSKGENDTAYCPLHVSQGGKLEA